MAAGAEVERLRQLEKYLKGQVNEMLSLITDRDELKFLDVLRSTLYHCAPTFGFTPTEILLLITCVEDKIEALEKSSV